MQSWRKKPGVDDPDSFMSPEGKAVARSRRRSVRDEREKAMELYRKGLSDEKVGRILGFSGSTVRYWRRRRGLPPNGRRVSGAGGPELLELTSDEEEALRRFGRALSVAHAACRRTGVGFDVSLALASWHKAARRARGLRCCRGAGGGTGHSG